MTDPISAESLIHAHLLRLVQDFSDEHGIQVMDVVVDWRARGYPPRRDAVEITVRTRSVHE